jgi:ATP-binding cassette subfamily B protein
MSRQNRESERSPQNRGGGPMGPGMMRGGEKAKDFRGTIRKLVQYLRKYQILILIVFCFAAAGAVFSIIGPKILGTVTTEVFEGIMAKITGTGEGINFDSIARTMLILLGLYVLSALFIYIQAGSCPAYRRRSRISSDRKFPGR